MVATLFKVCCRSSFELLVKGASLGQLQSKPVESDWDRLLFVRPFLWNSCQSSCSDTWASSLVLFSQSMLFRSSQNPRGAQTEISAAFTVFCHNLFVTVMPKIAHISLGLECLLKKCLKAVDYDPQVGWIKVFVLFYRSRYSLWRARIQLIRWERAQILR